MAKRKSKSIVLTDEQEAALEAMCSGRNVFLTGEAGTGKSLVLERFIKQCRKERREVLAMAPTGIAALNLPGGTTIHRTLGIPPTFCDPNEPLGLPRKVLRQAEVIVIDEISMCRIDLFERVVRMILSAQSSSGTKQVILVGDFFQLPPVVTNRDLEAMMAFYPGNPEGYCFKSNFWNGLALEPHVLTKVQRTAERDYLRALNAARRGDASCVEYFNARAVARREKAPEEALWLCVRNATADRINEERLGRLPGRERVFKAAVSGTIGGGDKPTNDELSLKVGARVMSVLNDPSAKRRYLNGSLGTVVGFEDDEVQVLFDEADEPVAIGAHKWQVNKAVVGEQDDPETGERVKRISLEEVGSFRQVPLRLAWAMTIHKAQGQTITGPVAVETHVFAAGQLYVGISRSTRIEDLTIYPKMEAREVHARRDVLEFYDRISAEGAYGLEADEAEGPAEPEAPSPDAVSVERGKTLMPGLTWMGEGLYRIAWSDGGPDFTADGPMWFSTPMELGSKWLEAGWQSHEGHDPIAVFVGGAR